MSPFENRPSRSERSPLVEVAPAVRTAAGMPATVEVTVTNRASGPRVFDVVMHGADPSWLPSPSRTPEVPPGGSVRLVLVLTPSLGSVAARYPLSVVVQASDPATGRPGAPRATADLLVVLDAPSAVGVDLAPREVTLRRSRRVEIVVTNDGAAPAEVRLESQVPHGLSLSLSQDHVVVPAAGSRAVRARLRGRGLRWVGASTRSAFAVVAHHSGAPRHVIGSVERRTVFGAGALKIIALVAVVGLWAGVGIVALPRLAHRLGQSSSASPSAAAAGAGAATDGAAGGSGGSGASGGSGGSGGSGAGGAGGAPAGVRLNGVMQGTATDGVTVSLRPTSLADGTTVDATPVGLSTQSLNAHAMVPEAALPRATTTTAAADRTTTTGSDGTWSFAGITAPGLYALTLSKAGYQEQRYIVDAASADATRPMKVALGTGAGTVSGTVSGPAGGVPGATVVLTDGVTTVTTQTATTGAVGQWTVSGLSTPSTYFVTASKTGLGTRSTVVTLGASGSATAALALQGGVAAITGTIQTLDDRGSLVGLGGATVTASDGGSLSRTGATVDTDGLAGPFTVPDLPTPGSYTVTISKPGYATVVQQVVLSVGQSSAAVSQVLQRPTGKLWGQVRVGVTPDSATGVVGAGLTLVGTAGSFKALSTSTGARDEGSYLFDDIPPGDYSLTGSLFGVASVSQPVTVVAGQGTESDVVLVGRAGDALPTSTSKVELTVRSADPLRPIRCAEATDPCITVSASPATSGQPALGSVTESGTVTLPTSGGLQPGVQQLTVSAPGFASVTTAVQVLPTVTTQVPPIELPPLAFVTGTVSGVSPIAVDSTEPGNKPTTCVVVTSSVSDQPGAGFDCVARTAPAPSADQPPSTPATTNTCAVTTGWCALAGPPTAPTDRTVPTEYCRSAAPGGYCVPGLAPGRYWVGVYTSHSEFRSAAPQPIVLGTSEARTLDVTLDRLPHLRITALRENAGLAPVVPDAGTAYARVAVAGGNTAVGAPIARTADTAANVFDFGRVPTGVALAAQVCVDLRPAGTHPTVEDYSSCLALRDGERLTQSLPIGALALDTPPATGDPTPVTLVATTSWVPFYARLGWVRDGVTIPLLGSVQVTGVGGYDKAGAPVQVTSGVTAVTDPRGCFVVTTSSSTIPPPPVPAECAGSATPVVVPSLVSPVVSFVAAPPALPDGDPTRFRTLTTTTQVGSGLLELSLAPNPATVAVPVVITPSPTAVPSGTTVTVIKGATPVVGISATVSTGSIAPSRSGFHLGWTDASLPGGSTDRAVPGTYTVAVTAPGYDGSTATLTCAEPTRPCTFDGPLTLARHAQVAVTVTSAATHSPVVGATVALIPQPARTIPAQTTGDDGGASFTDISASATVTYAVSVQATGYVSTELGLAALGCGQDMLGAGDERSCSVVLTARAKISGRVSMLIGPVDATHTGITQTYSGARVDLYPCAAACDASDHGNDVFASTTTATDGTYSLPSGGDGVGDRYWYVVVSAPTGGTAFPTEGRSVDLGVGRTPVDYSPTVTASPVTTTIVLTQNGRAVNDATVVLTDSTDTPTGPTSTPVAGGDGAYVFTVFPRAYTVSISGREYQPLITTITGADTTLSYAISLAGQTVPVTVLAPTRTSVTPVALTGATVSIGSTSAPFQVAQDTDGNPLIAETAPDGTVSIPAVPSGSYSIHVEAPGYDTATQSLTVRIGSGVSTSPFTLVRSRADLTVTVDVPQADTGAVMRVYADPAPGDVSNASTLSTSTSKTVGGSTVTATFTAVLSSTYTISFDLAPGRPDDVRRTDARAGDMTVTLTAPTPAGARFALHERRISVSASFADATGKSTSASTSTVTLTPTRGGSPSISVDLDGSDTTSSVWARVDTGYTATGTLPTSPSGHAWYVAQAAPGVVAGEGDASTAVAFAQEVTVTVTVTVDGAAATTPVTLVVTPRGSAPAVTPSGSGGIFSFEAPQGVTYGLTATTTVVVSQTVTNPDGTTTTVTKNVQKTGTAGAGPISGTPTGVDPVTLDAT